MKPNRLNRKNYNNTTKPPTRTEFHNSARGVRVLDHDTPRSQRRCSERSIYVNMILRGKPVEYYVNNYCSFFRFFFTDTFFYYFITNLTTFFKPTLYLLTSFFLVCLMVSILSLLQQFLFCLKNNYVLQECCMRL